MVELNLRPAKECRYDALSLGEVMLRLDPGDLRISTARSFAAWEGGGEYNVIRGLSRVFGLKTACLTSLVDNEVGHLIRNLMAQGGVDTSLIEWVPSDGIGRNARNGLNFTERGFGVRGAVGCSDRGNTAISQFDPSDEQLDNLFGAEGVRWLHTGGIYGALSAQSAQSLLRVLKAAKRHGVVVSYDLNYRPSLWKANGGQQQAQRVNKEVAKYVDVMIGNEEDFTACLGFEIPGVDENLTNLSHDSFAQMIEKVAAEYPNIKVIATTMRGVKSASRNDWGAIAWSAGDGFVKAIQRDDLEILDRVGGGDSFASGLVYGLISGESLQTCVDFGAAHGALAMTTPGDTSMATLSDVKKLAGGGNARVQR